MTVNDLLLVRVNVCGNFYSIRALRRQTGDVINDIPSMCGHGFARVNKHPKDPDHVLECCPMCRVVRAYNIKTSDHFIVHSGSTTFARMFPGPAGSLFVMDADCSLFKLVWSEDQSPEQEPKSISASAIPSATTTEPLRLCYIEHHDILMYTVEVDMFDYDPSIIAVKLESGAIIWKICGEVEGQVIKPFAISCDPEDNAYVSDRNSNRILKIDGLTGDV